MEDPYKRYEDEMRKRMERYSFDKANVLSNMKRPFFYLKIKRVMKKIEKRIKIYDPSYNLPKIKIRVTFKEGVSASCNVHKGNIVMRVNVLYEKKGKGIDMELERHIAHELMHLWIGHDLLTGQNILPQHEPLIKNWRFYLGKNYSLRYKLCCFLYQQVMIGKIGKKLMHLKGYEDIWFKNGRNPFVNFEEMLVSYATMKLFNDPLEVYPALKQAFEENYEDKKLLTFINKEMPNIRLAIEKLVNEF